MPIKKQAIVIDLDSTLIDSSHRKWDSFDLIKDDVLRKDLRNLCVAYRMSSYEIIILSARENLDYIDKTVKQLTIENLKSLNLIMGLSYSQIILKESSYEDESHFEFKRRVIEKLMNDYKIELFIDDNEETIDEIKKLGITCLQCKYKKLYEWSS